MCWCEENYRACNLDCAATLRLNPNNVKAWYRSASACLALDKIAEAEDACARGLEVEKTNAALKILQTKIQKRKEQVEETERKRREREERLASEKANLAMALKARNIKTRKTDKAPDTEDAVLRLEDPTAPHSTLIVPVLLLYPLHAQSDFIKAFEEGQSLNDHLDYILPLPWDETHEYALPDSVECYIETTTGGLIKAGKKLQLLKIISSGKVEIVDGLLRIYVVPKEKAPGWIQEFKVRQPQRT
jgi:tetratricopeptide (TPR) repeat protein